MSCASVKVAGFDCKFSGHLLFKDLRHGFLPNDIPEGFIAGLDCGEAQEAPDD